MANKGFNGSTLTFVGQAIGSLLGISYSKKWPRVNITCASDAVATEIPGIPVIEVSCDIVGGTLPSGASGALAASWFDGTSSGTLTSAGLVGVDVKGSMDGEISGTLTFCNMP